MQDEIALRGGSLIPVPRLARAEALLCVGLSGTSTLVRDDGARFTLAEGELLVLPLPRLGGALTRLPERGAPRVLFVPHARVEASVHITREGVAADALLEALVGVVRAVDATSADERARLLTPALRALALAVARTTRAHARTKDTRVARALDLMCSRLGDALTLAALAKHAGLSRAAFVRRFAAEVGETPLRHLAGLRLAHAKTLLRETDRSLAEIAVDVGYANEFAFGRAFKRAFGVPPGTFRRAPTRATLRLAA